MGVPSNNPKYWIEIQGLICYVNILTKFNTNVSLFECVVFLVPAKLWTFLEARMLYDKCIENQWWSYP